MQIEMACERWMKEDDRTVYQYLLQCGSWPTAAEAAAATQLRKGRVRRSLNKIRLQMDYARNRRFYLAQLENKPGEKPDSK